MYKPTLEQYRELGLEMKKTRLHLTNLEIQASRMIGKSKFDMFYMIKRFDTLIGQTEALMFSRPPEGLDDLNIDEQYDIFHGDNGLQQQMKDIGELPLFGYVDTSNANEDQPVVGRKKRDLRHSDFNWVEPVGGKVIPEKDLTHFSNMSFNFKTQQEVFPVIKPEFRYLLVEDD